MINLIMVKVKQLKTHCQCIILFVSKPTFLLVVTTGCLFADSLQRIAFSRVEFFLSAPVHLLLFQRVSINHEIEQFGH